MSKFSVIAFATLIIGLLCCAPAEPAQSPSASEWRRCAPMATSHTPHTIARLTVTTGPIGLLAAYFCGAGPWFHGPAHFSGHVHNRF